MIYTKTPQYPHFAHLPFAKEPLKTIYVIQRILTTILLVPLWVLYYSIVPRGRRPRESWSLKQIVFVGFTRRMFRVTEVAGVVWGARDPEEGVGDGELGETRFEWVGELRGELRGGVLVGGGGGEGEGEGRVPWKRVGCFVWPKRVERREGQTDVVGIFMHGGGYAQMSAHENSRTSNIPRRLIKDGLCTEIYSVEYRLLQHAPFPAVIMDAAAVYAYVVEKYPMSKIILIGDSSGGNLVLALARWIRDEGKLRMPDGLLLFSPSCDTSHAFHSTPSSYIPRPNADTDYLTDTPEPRALLQRTFLGFKYRPGGTGWGQWEKGKKRNGSDQMEKYLSVGSAEDPKNKNKKENGEIERETKALMGVVHSEYVSPASPRVLSRWGHVVDLYNGERIYGGGSANGSGSGSGSGEDQQERRQEQDSEEVTIPKVSKVWLTPTIACEQYEWEDHTGTGTTRDDLDLDLRDLEAGAGAGAEYREHPIPRRRKFNKLFEGFPKTFIAVGDAERLTIEVGNLARAMGKDADTRTDTAWDTSSDSAHGEDNRELEKLDKKEGLVRLAGGHVVVRWIRDGVHDVFIIPDGWWDEGVKREVWEDVRVWMRGFRG